MTTTSEQAASQPSPPPNGSATPAPEGTDQTDPSLESLLAEFKPAEPTPSQSSKPAETKPAETAASPAPQAPSLSAQDRQAIDGARALLDERAAEKLKGDIDSAVKTLKEANEGLKGLPDRLIRGALHDLAAEDERFREAFMRRHQDPKAWAGVLKAASGELAKEIGGVQSQSISRDRASVLAAGRGSSDAPPVTQVTNADISKMSDRQFKEYKAELRSQARR